jgi:glucan phosphoethanolaminetransferase (alkaline phosphatase superfamily)
MIFTSHKKLLLIAFGFTFLTTVFEAFVFGGYRHYVVENFKISDIHLLSVKYYILALIGFFFCFCLLWTFVYLSLISVRAVKPFYYLFFLLLTLYEYTYQDLFGRFSTIQDLSLAFITTSTQSIDAIVSYTSYAAVMPCGAYLILLLLINSDRRISVKRSLVSLAIFIVVTFGFNLAMWKFAPTFYFYESVTNAFGAGNRTLFGYAFAKTLYTKTIRESVENPGSNTKPRNNIILILDESVRGDHLSLNGYSRPTTPFLVELEKRKFLKNWGIAVSSSTRSFESFQYIMTGLSPNGDTGADYKVEQLPTLFQFAKAMNYRTYYFDGQLDKFWGGDSGDLEFIDIFLSKKFFEPVGAAKWEIDDRIAVKVRETTANSTGNFIVVFKRGNHTPYNSNFPEAAAVWLPTSETYAQSVFDSDRETFVNTYDNALRYNLDGFFRTLLTDKENLPNDTVVLYTSDHGQTLNENGEKYSHGGDTKTQAIVPLFIIGNIEKEVDTGFKASHANIFATILDLMKFPEDKRKRKYSISLLNAKGADSIVRYFFTPNVMPGDNQILLGERIRFD